MAEANPTPSKGNFLHVINKPFSTRYQVLKVLTEKALEIFVENIIFSFFPQNVFKPSKDKYQFSSHNV